MTDPYDDSEFLELEQYYSEAQAELIQECASYILGAAHSTDDGWFYHDDNDNELPNSDFYD